MVEGEDTARNIGRMWHIIVARPRACFFRRHQDAITVDNGGSLTMYTVLGMRASLPSEGWRREEWGKPYIQVVLGRHLRLHLRA